MQSPSWSWLPIVVAPGCLGHPTSTVSDRATKLFIIMVRDVILTLRHVSTILWLKSSITLISSVAEENAKN